MNNLPKWNLSFALFFTRHKIFLKNASTFALFFFDLFLIFQFGLRLINYQIETLSHQNMIYSLTYNLIDYKKIHERTSPRPLEVGSIYIITSGENSYDLVAEASNPNNRWGVEKLEYQFIINGEPQEIKETFFLPQEEKYLMAFRIESTKFPSIHLKLVGVNWRKVKKTDSPSLSPQIIIKNKEFIPRKISSKNLLLPNLLQFEAENSSPYSFWEVGFQIVLFQDLKPVAASFLVLEKFLSKEKREIQTSWTQDIPYVTRIGIKTEVNLLDPEVVMKIQGGKGSPSGFEN